MMTEHTKRAPGEAPDSADDVGAQLRRARREIDQLDEEIVRLLNARAGHALTVGHLKESGGMERYQPGREIAVLEHVRRANEGPLDAGAVTRLFERIIDENRRLERLAERSAGADTQNVPESTNK